LGLTGPLFLSEPGSVSKDFRLDDSGPSHSKTVSHLKGGGTLFSVESILNHPFVHVRGERGKKLRNATKGKEIPLERN